LTSGSGSASPDGGGSGGAGGEEGSSTGTGGGSTTGEPEDLCWAKTCDADHPCAPGLECETHPDQPGIKVCSAPCVVIGPNPECVTEPFACQQEAPLGQCFVGMEGVLRCFPAVCQGAGDCLDNGGDKCVDGFCY